MKGAVAFIIFLSLSVTLEDILSTFRLKNLYKPSEGSVIPLKPLRSLSAEPECESLSPSPSFRAGASDAARPRPCHYPAIQHLSNLFSPVNFLITSVKREHQLTVF